MYTYIISLNTYIVGHVYTYTTCTCILHPSMHIPCIHIYNMCTNIVYLNTYIVDHVNIYATCVRIIYPSRHVLRTMYTYLQHVHVCYICTYILCNMFTYVIYLNTYVVYHVYIYTTCINILHPSIHIPCIHICNMCTYIIHLNTYIV